jgi:SPP1 gp7 family putative phage head morphogenesis protein
MADTDRFPFPKEAAEFLSKKENINTEAWTDLKWGEHSHAFTVAHSMNTEVVGKIHELLNKAMANGESFSKFRKGMIEMMKAEKWYGGAGHTADDKKYIDKRIKTIYHTNMRTAYAAGRYRKQLQSAALRPIWQYVSKLVGNRRPDHLALHGKAFRFDDPFWNENYPPNGWGCDCSVVSLSESGAEREHVEVLESGNLPPLINNRGELVDWKGFSPAEWQYNPGKEALAPTFLKYEGLPEKIRDAAISNYRNSMDGTVLKKEEWDVIAKRVSEPYYKPTFAMFQIGNLSDADFKTVREKVGIFDSKVMATDYNLYHSMGNKRRRIKEAIEENKPKNKIQKLAGQPVDFKDYETVFKMYSNPEHIYLEEFVKDNSAGIKNREWMNRNVRLLHFTKDMGNGKFIKIVFEIKSYLNSRLQPAMQLVTMEYINDYHYKEQKYVPIK